MNSRLREVRQGLNPDPGPACLICGEKPGPGKKPESSAFERGGSQPSEVSGEPDPIRLVLSHTSDGDFSVLGALLSVPHLEVGRMCLYRLRTERTRDPSRVRSKRQCLPAQS